MLRGETGAGGALYPYLYKYETVSLLKAKYPPFKNSFLTQDFTHPRSSRCAEQDEHCSEEERKKKGGANFHCQCPHSLQPSRTLVPDIKILLVTELKELF